MKDELIFRNLKLDYKKLKDIGFNKIEDNYKYESMIMDNQFVLVITIDKNNIVTSKVLETDTLEEYFLYNVETSIGNFVGKMREEYERVIDKVKKNVVLGMCLKVIMLN